MIRSFIGLFVYGMMVYILFLIFGSLLWAAIKVAVIFAVIDLIYYLITGKGIVNGRKKEY